VLVRYQPTDLIWQAVIAFLVQGFYCWRVYVVVPYRWVTAALVVTAICSLREFAISIYVHLLLIDVYQSVVLEPQLCQSWSVTTVVSTTLNSDGFLLLGWHSLPLLMFSSPPSWLFIWYVAIRFTSSPIQHPLSAPSTCCVQAKPGHDQQDHSL
jgi:hypothetical protein